MKHSPLKRKSKQTLPRLHSKAWTLMSAWVRMRDKCVCITCNKSGDMAQMQGGHYIHGNSFDFIDENINCQCVHCNYYQHGAPKEYTIAIDKKYGVGTAERLLAIKHNIRRFTRSELESIIEQLQIKIKELNK